MTNPFLEPSDLPFGMPPFEDIRPEHYLEAFEAGMAEQLRQVQAITFQRSMPTFENTMLALEKSGQILDRVSRVFFNKTQADSDDFTDDLEATLAPRLAAHADEIRLNEQLYWRISHLYELREKIGLDAESRYLIERYHSEFTLAGAGLDPAQKEQLKEFNRRLSTLTTSFDRNEHADSNDLAVLIESEDDLAGLSPGEISAAAQSARARGIEHGWLITLVLPTGHPTLANLERRSVRERIMTASRSRGRRGNQWDTREIVLEIARLRSQRALLLGFADHASWVTADEMAGNPKNVNDLLSRLAIPAARNAEIEQEALQVRAGHPIEAHDWAYFAEKIRAEKYDVDTAALRPYFESERVLKDGVFHAATALYGITFTERFDIPCYHPEVRVFEVRNEDGTAIGLYTLDLYARDSKRGGAWMDLLVSQSTLLDQLAVVTNTLNVPKPATGEPTLLTFDEVETLFHEFGHALHGLFATVTYPKFAGTNTLRDFVEFPSQVNEMWMLWPEVLAGYAVHHETGEKLPQHVAESIIASRAFNEGFKTSEYLAAAMLDQAWHRITPDVDPGTVDAFEEATLAKVGLNNPAVPPRYGSTYFQHVFGGGYDAGYYSYIWSEVLDADTVQWFLENGGLTRKNGDRFRSMVLGVGGSKDPAEAYRDFRGRDPDPAALLAKRGLI